jgi:hypothetical protein
MKLGREDWQFNIALGQKGYCGRHLAWPGYLYRREGQNRTLRNTTPEWHAEFLAQLRQLYPALYRGERPMGCCGGGRLARATGLRASSARTQTSGGDEMPELVEMEYLLDNASPQTYRGPVTQRRYTFGGRYKTGQVDKRDAEAMVALRENTLEVFKASGVKARKAGEKLTPRQQVAVESAINAHLGPRLVDENKRAAYESAVLHTTSPESDSAVPPGSYAKTGTVEDALRRLELAPEAEARAEVRAERNEAQAEVAEAAAAKVERQEERALMTAEEKRDAIRAARKNSARASKRSAKKAASGD